MPHFNIIKETNPDKTFRVSSVMGKFDLQTNHVIDKFTGNIDIEGKEWQIGLIVGKSGTGKTTIAKEIFSKNIIQGYKYKNHSILDDMPEHISVDEITKTFNSVGFSSPPNWLKSYSVLSTGEKMRVDLARAILENEELFVFDEFTSVVDRQVAEIGSFAIQKAIRRTDKKFIAISCHYDIIDWLLPDWIFDTDSMTFQYFGEQKKNRPELNLKIHETNEKKYYWNLFSRYHYLNHSHNNSARVFIASLNDNICGYCSILHLPHPKAKNIKIGHRLVIFPDYQGMSLSHIFLNNVAEIIKNEGNRFCFTTSNPAMIFYLKSAKNWKCTSIGRKENHNGEMSLRRSGSFNRTTTSWEHVS